MTKAEDSGKDIGDFFDVVVPALTIRSSMWGTSLGRKPNRFLDGEGREMNIVLGGVLDVTTVMSGDFVGSQRIVMDITPDVVVGVALVCEHFEECRASRSRAAQNNWRPSMLAGPHDRWINSRSISPGLTTPLKSWRIVLVDGRSEFLNSLQTALGLIIDPTVCW